MAQTPAPGLTPPPNSIVASAFKRLRSYRIPLYAVYLTTWHMTYTDAVGTTAWEARHRYAVRESDELENATLGTQSDGKLPKADVLPVFLGPLAWNVRVVAPAHEDDAMRPDVSSVLRTIATVVAREPPVYDVRLTGIESQDGHRLYHVTLRPLEHPEKHNLRDLWVDVQTFDLWKVRFIGVYSPDARQPKRTSEVTIQFAPVGGYWILSEAIWSYAPFVDSARYVYDVSMDNIAFPATLPDWLFDRHAYDAHRAAGEQDVLNAFLPPG